METDRTQFVNTKLNVNQVSLIDSYLQNPFSQTHGLKSHQYITIESSSQYLAQIKNIAFQLEFSLSDRMILRERIVYDIVTFIAEISGFVDMLMVSAFILLRTFYQPKMLEQALVKHMSVFISNKKNKPFKVANLTERIQKNDADFLKFITLEMRQRFRIRFSVYFILVASFLPSRCRSERSNVVLGLAHESLKKLERSLDVKKIQQSQ